jgi:hypothetical protein
MGRKKKSEAIEKPHPLGWIFDYEYRINGRVLVPGTELKLFDRRGRFRFLKHGTDPQGREWLDLFGGLRGYEKMIAVKPEAVRTVHRIKKTRGA